MRWEKKRVGLLIVNLLFSINLCAQQLDWDGTSTGSSLAILPSEMDMTARAANGAVPRLIKFSGVINSHIPEATQTAPRDRRQGGPPRLMSATFSLYALQEDGHPLWSESQQIELDDQCRYTVLLGAAQPVGLPLDLFTSGKALWLGVQPQLPAAAEQPRVLLVAVPYALKAADADTLGGKPASSFLTVDSLQNGALTSTK